MMMDKVRPLISQGKSLLIEGGAGVGKSHLTRLIISELEPGTLQSPAPTHASCKQLPNCVTIHHWAHKVFRGGRIPKLSAKTKTIIIDEVGFLSIFLTTLLAEIQHVNIVRFILVGYILGQFGSPCNYYHDTEITDLQISQSGLLKSLSNGNTVRLYQCRRSCKELFDIY